MNCNKDMLKLNLQEMNNNQRKEIDSIFKVNKKLGDAQFNSLEEQIDSCDDLTYAIKTFNSFRLHDKYKYSAVFMLDDSNNRTIEEIIKSIPKFNSQSNVDFFYLDDPGLYFTESDSSHEYALNYIVKYEEFTGDRVIKKTYFNGLLIAFHTINEITFVEICISDIKLKYRNDENYFMTMIDIVKNMIKKMLDINLLNIKFNELIYDISENHDLENVRCTGKSMFTQTRANATLKSGKSTNLILPILGDLENFMLENSILFSSNSETKLIFEKLNEFIDDIKSSSHYPWMCLTWGGRSAAKNKLVEVRYEFHSKYTILNYYSHNLGRGGMRNATRVLLEKYVEASSKTETSNIEESAS